MKKQLTAAVLAALMTGVPYAAYAQEAPPPGGGMLMRADADHDGNITRAEFLADVDQRFALVDANHDGRISAEERDAAREAMTARRGGGDGPGRGGGMGARADTDGDGSISLAEQRAQATGRFDRLDADHDGNVDKTELAAMRGRGGPPPPADAPKN